MSNFRKGFRVILLLVTVLALGVSLAGCTRSDAPAASSGSAPAAPPVKKA